ncbi:hypothetical protein GQ600_13457 [Phytophthora cactorum]|nr:hypothetical protein GQ600_13457 [Phytophthora cactorum]
MNGALFPFSFFNPSLKHVILRFSMVKAVLCVRCFRKSCASVSCCMESLFENMTSGWRIRYRSVYCARKEVLEARLTHMYTCPSSDTIVYPGDKIFVLINVMALNRLANKLQRRFRNRSKPSMTLADLVETISRPSQL